MGRVLSLVLFVLLFLPCHAYTGDNVIPPDVKCSECGMGVDPSSKFSAWVLDDKGGKLFFCDVGDMLNHYKNDINRIRSAGVRDYTTGQWIDGKKAFYISIKGIKTPMSWGIAAFRDKSNAEKFGSPSPFMEAFRLLK